MSAPKVPSQADALLDPVRIWQAAAAEWLGLDPADIADFDDNLNDLDRRPASATQPPEEVRFTWMTWGESEPTKPSRGNWLGWSMSGCYGEPTKWFGTLTLDWLDERALIAALGPKPRWIPLEQELMLRGLGSLPRARA